MEWSPEHVHGHYCLVRMTNSEQSLDIARIYFVTTYVIIYFVTISLCSLYIAMGFFGYLKYGADIASTITLNMDLVCFYLHLVPLLHHITNPQQESFLFLHPQRGPDLFLFPSSFSSSTINISFLTLRGGHHVHDHPQHGPGQLLVPLLHQSAHYESSTRISSASSSFFVHQHITITLNMDLQGVFLLC